MNPSELWRWGAVELAGAIRARQVSAREAVQSCLARIDAVNPRINAIVDSMADEALQAADRADKAVKSGAALGALHGVPVTLKINVDVAGRPTTNGVVAFKDKTAAAESPPVIQWRGAGAIFVGRTNVPAFSTRYFTDNALHGRTLNPWDAKRTPGGSSGGGHRDGRARARQRPGRIDPLSVVRLRRVRAAADARAHRHLRARRPGDARDRNPARQYAGAARALDPRSAPRHRGHDGARSA